MNRLLGAFVDIALPLIIVAIAIVVAVFLYRFLKKKYSVFWRGGDGYWSFTADITSAKRARAVLSDVK